MEISKSLFDLLVSKNFTIKTLDSKGKPVLEPELTEMFSFDYEVNGNNYGTVVILLNDEQEFEIYYGDNVGKRMEAGDKDAWFDFLTHLRYFAKRNLYSFTLKNINQLKYSMQGMAAIKEGLFEGWNGTSKTSYNNSRGKTRLMIKHNKQIGEGEQRWRAIQSLFIETADGERFKLPFNNLAAGRAMTRHVQEGGNPYDAFGEHIIETVREVNTLSRFVRATKAITEDDDQFAMVEAGRSRYKTLRQRLKQIQGKRGYHSYISQWTPEAAVEDEEMVNELRNTFTRETLDTRIEEALPILARLQDSNMKELQEFENWTTQVSEGTWSIPDSEQKLDKLKQFMSQPLEVGVDATNATELLYDIIGDDELFDAFAELAKKDPAADARPAIQSWLEDHCDELESVGINIDNIGYKWKDPQAQEEVAEVKDLDSGEECSTPKRDPMLEMQRLAGVKEDTVMEKVKVDEPLEGWKRSIDRDYPDAQYRKRQDGNIEAFVLGGSYNTEIAVGDYMTQGGYGYKYDKPNVRGRKTANEEQLDEWGSSVEDKISTLKKMLQQELTSRNPDKAMIVKMKKQLSMMQQQYAAKQKQQTQQKQKAQNVGGTGIHSINPDDYSDDDLILAGLNELNEYGSSPQEKMAELKKMLATPGMGKDVEQEILRRMGELKREMSGSEPVMADINEDSTATEYRDKEGRFVVVYNYDKRAYQAIGQGAYKKQIEPQVFDRLEDAIQHGELEVAFDLGEAFGLPLEPMDNSNFKTNLKHSKLSLRDRTRAKQLLAMMQDLENGKSSGINMDKVKYLYDLFTNKYGDNWKDLAMATESYSLKDYMEELALDEDRASDAIDQTYGQSGFWEDLKDFFRGNFISAIEANKEYGIKMMKRKGFSDEEIQAIRKAFYFAMGEYFDEQGIAGLDAKDDWGHGAMPNDDNFHGWSVPIQHNLDSMYDAVKPRVIEYLRKYLTTNEAIVPTEPGKHKDDDGTEYKYYDDETGELFYDKPEGTKRGYKDFTKRKTDRIKFSRDDVFPGSYDAADHLDRFDKWAVISDFGDVAAGGGDPIDYVMQKHGMDMEHIDALAKEQGFDNANDWADSYGELADTDAYGNKFEEDLNEVKAGPFNSKAIGSKVKVMGQDSFKDVTYNGETGTIVKAYREHTFSRMVPWKIEYVVELDNGTKATVRREQVKKVKETQANEEVVTEKAPPGMEKWIKDRKPEFKKRYGDKWQEVLYATAWKQHNKNESVEEDMGGMSQKEAYNALFQVSKQTIIANYTDLLDTLGTEDLDYQLDQASRYVISNWYSPEWDMSDVKEMVDNVIAEVKDAAGLTEAMDEDATKGATKAQEKKFHKDLDDLVHRTFGKREEEMVDEGMGDPAGEINLPPFLEDFLSDVLGAYWTSNGQGGPRMGSSTEFVYTSHPSAGPGNTEAALKQNKYVTAMTRNGDTIAGDISGPNMEDYRFQVTYRGQRYDLHQTWQFYDQNKNESVNETTSNVSIADIDRDIRRKYPELYNQVLHQYSYDVRKNTIQTEISNPKNEGNSDKIRKAVIERFSTSNMVTNEATIEKALNAGTIKGAVKINEDNGQQLNVDLIAYPNRIGERPMKLPAGTSISIAPGGDLYKPGLESSKQVIRITDGNKTYITKADDYYNAVQKGMKEGIVNRSTLTDPYEQGFYAKRADSNPYQPGTEEAARWDKGNADAWDEWMADMRNDAAYEDVNKDTQSVEEDADADAVIDRVKSLAGLK